MKLRIVSLALLGLTTVASVAAAEPDAGRARAAEAFKAGQAAFRAHDYERAAERFEQAAAIAPHAATLLNAAEARESGGQPERAAELCDRVLAMPAVEARFRAAATAQLERLAPKIGTLEVVGDPSRRVRLGAVELPIPLRRRVMPGPITFDVVDPQTLEREARSADVAAGSTVTVDVTRRPVVEPAPAPVVPRATRAKGPPTLSWVSFGVAGVAGATAGIFGVRTLDAHDAFDRDPSPSTRDDFYRDRLVTNVALGTAVVAAAVGVVVWLVDGPRRAEADATVGALR